MVFGHIHKLQQEYTDKFVSVDDQSPELHRFKGLTGTVKTVNMSGRALVEFTGNENIGWYDIDVDFLKVIDPPIETEKPSVPAAKKTAVKKAPAPPKDAAPKPETPKPETPKPETPKPGAKQAGAKQASSSAGGESVADILAAARSGAAAPAKESAKKPAKDAPADKPVAAKASVGKGQQGMSVEDIMAAARGQVPATTRAKPASAAAATEAKTDPDQLSVAEILAAARKPKSAGESGDVTAAMEKGRGKKGNADTAKPAAKAAPKAMSVADILAAARGNASAGEATAKEPAEPASSAATPAPSAAASTPAAQADPKTMSVADILAAARANTLPGTTASSSAPADQDDAAPAPAPSAAASKPAAQADPKTMSVADILAAARANTPPGATASSSAPADQDDAQSSPTQSSPGKTDVAAGALPTEVADIVAYCRRVDA